VDVSKSKTKKKFKTVSRKHTDPPELPPVLLVDDTVFNLMILQNIFLLNYKIKTDQAISGEEALAKCKARIDLPYKFIVMDINMPGMDGVVTTGKIRELEPYKGVGLSPNLIVAHTALPEE
jgi:CheY-like chemotaxis protein